MNIERGLRRIVLAVSLAAALLLLVGAAPALADLGLQITVPIPSDEDVPHLTWDQDAAGPTPDRSAAAREQQRVKEDGRSAGNAWTDLGGVLCGVLIVSAYVLAFVALEYAKRAERWEGRIGDLARAWGRTEKVVGGVVGKVLFGFYMALLGLGFLVLAVVGVMMAAVGLLSF